MTSETQHRVLDCIRAYPGIHLRGIERLLGMSSALVHYHVRDLLAKDIIIDEELHGRRRYFDADPARSKRLSQDERDILALLREEAPMNVVLLLLDDGPMSHGELVAQTGLAKSTVTYNIDKLVAAGIVEKDEKGDAQELRLADEKRLRGLLMGHAPTPDLMRKFRRLWEDFYSD
ncbi:MAG: winged helix-turn-helix transcriptional regulator [Euryarchaeota archaeon]|nr:winged helix-turn-helix transcriptional regulator [Euryarchaeota archaeon]